MSQDFSDQRKIAFYFGSALMGVGLLLFLSVFITHIMDFGDFTDFTSKAKSSGARAIGGMALMMIGGFVRSIGARGFAGSGLVLDTKRARGELEPYSRMSGGMIKDALDEADIDLGSSRSAKPEQVVMIRCGACRKLNEEDSKFCQECGATI
ncbi:MAG: hypothetical protein ACJAZ8_001112 [Planctomycetota bacterium]|jgi:hypothetical protein